MSTFKIIKKGANNFWHWFNNDSKKVAISDFEVVLDEVSQTFVIVYKNGANIPNQSVNVVNIEVIDETDASLVETFANVVDLRTRLVELGYTPYLSANGIQSIVAGTNVTIDNTDPANPVISASGSGGGSVSANDVTETATRVFVTPTQQTAITHSNRSVLDAITESFTTALKTAYDDAVTWITTNGTNILNHIASTSNPHNVTKSQVGLSNVVNADTTTTANITDSTNKRFVTDANLVVIGNTSGTNSGDNATNTTSNAYADAKVASELASFKTDNFIDFTSSGQTQLDGKVDKTTWTDYSALSTIVGIGVFAEKQIWYKVVDGYMIVDFSLFGNSNSVQLTFTVPFASAEGFTIYRPTGYLQNMGGIVNSFGRSSIANGSNVVILRRDAAGVNDWAASSSKGTNGQITFKI